MLEKIIDGKKLAQSVLDNIASEVQGLEARKPTLAVILVGDHEASKIYIANKKLACSRVGIISKEYLLKNTTTEEELLALIQELNHDVNVDGILVQLPLPHHLSSKIVTDSILPNKDVDGFHPYNMGSLVLNKSQIHPCTPYGIMYLLNSLKIDYHGKNVVIVGRSNIVGRPMALEMLNAGATVTVCNSKTKHLDQVTSTADILIVAIGKPKFITEEYIKDGAIVVDVGITREDSGKLCGDVDFNNVFDKVSAITPVPGGVGPLTIAMLIANTLKCYYLNRDK